MGPLWQHPRCGTGFPGIHTESTGRIVLVHAATAERMADTADCPWRNSATYIVICPSVIACRTVLIAIRRSR